MHYIMKTFKPSDPIYSTHSFSCPLRCVHSPSSVFPTYISFLYRLFQKLSGILRFGENCIDVARNTYIGIWTVAKMKGERSFKEWHCCTFVDYQMHMSYRTANLKMLHFFIYSTNIRTEYFKHAAHSPFFPLQNAVYFIMQPFLVPVLFTL